jgi:hypothetical protein
LAAQERPAQQTTEPAKVEQTSPESSETASQKAEEALTKMADLEAQDPKKIVRLFSDTVQTVKRDLASFKAELPTALPELPKNIPEDKTETLRRLERYITLMQELEAVGNSDAARLNNLGPNNQEAINVKDKFRKELNSIVSLYLDINGFMGSSKFEQLGADQKAALNSWKQGLDPRIQAVFDLLKNPEDDFSAVDKLFISLWEDLYNKRKNINDLLVRAADMLVEIAK